MKVKELRALKLDRSEWDKIEEAIKEVFRKEIYVPLMREFYETSKALKNSKQSDLEALHAALQSGKVTYSRGRFSGRFSSKISSVIRSLGASFDRKTGSFKIPKAELPQEIQTSISASNHRFQEKIDKIDKRLSDIIPEELADKVKVSHIFDRTLWKTNRDFESSVKGITIAPRLSDEQRKKIADEWENNLKLYIRDFTKEQTSKLRTKMQKSVFAGNRYESAVKSIQKSYGVTAEKAKFLARQETSLLTAKFKETRYQDAGINEFIWTCVHMPHASKTHSAPGDVRYTHAILDKKFFRFDDPREIDEKGRFKPGGVKKPNPNKNPGEDYNCRCTAKPIVRF